MLGDAIPPLVFSWSSQGQRRRQHLVSAQYDLRKADHVAAAEIASSVSEPYCVFDNDLNVTQVGPPRLDTSHGCLDTARLHAKAQAGAISLSTVRC